MTLFASGDSVTTAELAPCCTRVLRLDATVRDSVPHFMLMIDKVRERAKEFDVFHFHIDFFDFPGGLRARARNGADLKRGRSPRATSARSSPLGRVSHFDQAMNAGTLATVLVIRSAEAIRRRQPTG